MKLRAAPLERVVARICREAGARVQTNVYLRDMNLHVMADDDRRIEVVASGLPLFGGQQLAVDVTMYGALTADGRPRPRATWQDGAALRDARRDKERRYPEFLRGARCRLVVVALETGGRFSAETIAFLVGLSQARARAAPAYLRRAAEFAYFRRWSRLLAVAAASSLAASLIEEKPTLCLDASPDGEAPWLADLLAEARHDDGLMPSRLPLRH